MDITPVVFRKSNFFTTFSIDYDLQTIKTIVMAKGQDVKKAVKKEPLKTAKEKKEEKREKKNSKKDFS